MDSVIETTSEERPAAPDLAPVAAELLHEVEQELRRRTAPSATYRLQFTPDFTFRDATAIASYLAQLGVSHAYASPFFQSCPGSRHGYDVVDPSRLNSELGTPEDFADWVAALHKHQLGQILDMVPNHMGISSDRNPWWWDVLENGQSSAYASYFDIDWHPLKPDLEEKVLLPVLGQAFGQELEGGFLQIGFEGGAFQLKYHDRRFPISPRSYATILNLRLSDLEQERGAEDPAVVELASILTAIRNLPLRAESDLQKLKERRREKEVIKRRLAELCQSQPEIDTFVRGNLQLINGRAGESASFDLLDRLLDEQPYRLAYWRVAADEINYRRFFDVNDLAAITMEYPEVFQASHALVLELLKSGAVQGVRIDHPDGLYDPVAYLSRLQQSYFLIICEQVWQRRSDRPVDWATLQPELLKLWESRKIPSQSPAAKPLYLVVEKILGTGEQLPSDWPVDGTVGYETLQSISGVFIDASAAKSFDRIYERFSGEEFHFPDLVYTSKKLILHNNLSSELSVLGHQLDRISERDRWTRDFTRDSLTSALEEVIACFPVYRTYTSDRGLSDRDRQYVIQATSRAKRRNRATSATIFDFVRDVLLLEPKRLAVDPAAVEKFVGRFQQMTGPVTAKAVEDTAFYTYQRLVSLNEVGGDPEQFGVPVAEFHRRFTERNRATPLGLTASSTHDTKRSEDVRARINVLSEIPKEWQQQLKNWTRWNRRFHDIIDGEPSPGRNEEYFLYQTLIGTWPFDADNPEVWSQYLDRIEQYLVKASREAKVHTSWISPHEKFERAFAQYLRGILDPNQNKSPFLEEFRQFTERVADFGIWNSLSQTLLKVTLPGVPDFYQGTELWDFSLVDPDNRRPVDYAKREQLLAELNQALQTSPRLELLAELMEQRRDGRIKLLTTHLALQLRRQALDAFQSGEYIPLATTGPHSEHLLAFARRSKKQTVIVVVPRLLARKTQFTTGLPIGRDFWESTRVVLPEAMAKENLSDIFTRANWQPNEHPDGFGFDIAELLQAFPVASLVSR